MCGDNSVHGNPALTLIIKQQTKSNPPNLNLSNTGFYIILPSGSSCSDLLSKPCIPFCTKCMLHATYPYYLPATIILIISDE
jgi:hypothetical protein